ncbi:hypothetical protein FRC04_002008 [Tulasnella sp. 424]|nr:hypothetical protein FRC04_002008 [Tulasnella sp. 424]KAG8968044.1 hypothetical protein FRC05_001677 [Tulasnella sp. 425]
MFGFGSPAYDPKAETPNLSGKVAVVTGGNAGIGRESARHLVTYGAKVYIAARNEARIQESIEDFRKNGAFENGGSAHMLLVDFSSLKDVKRAADEFASKEQRLDILLNNVGMLANQKMEYTNEGLQTLFAINSFGPFLFINTLLPILKKTASEPGSDIRVVSVASGSIYYPPHIPKIEGIEDLYLTKGGGMWDAMKRYGFTKLCDVFIIHELQRRMTEENVPITCLCADPGAVASTGVNNSLNVIPTPFRQLIWQGIKLSFQTPEVGSYSSKFATTSTKVAEDREKYKGAYIFSPAKIQTVKGQAADVELAKQFWVLAEKVCEEILRDGQLNGQPVSTTL